MGIWDNPIWGRRKTISDVRQWDSSDDDEENDFAGFCTVCGKRLKSGWKFCPNCGSVVKRYRENDEEIVKGNEGKPVKVLGKCPVCGNMITERDEMRVYTARTNGWYEYYAYFCEGCYRNFKKDELESADKRTSNDDDKTTDEKTHIRHYLWMKAVNYNFGIHPVDTPESTTWLINDNGFYKKIVRYRGAITEEKYGRIWSMREMQEILDFADLCWERIPDSI